MQATDTELVSCHTQSDMTPDAGRESGAAAKPPERAENHVFSAKRSSHVKRCFTCDIPLVLSADFELRTTGDLLSASTLDAYPELSGRYALVDKFMDSTYIVNESIYHFLQLFHEPVTVEHVCDLLVTDEESRKNVRGFIDDLRQRDILVSKRRNAIIARQQIAEQALPPVDVDPARVLRVMKHTRDLWVGLVHDETGSQPHVLKKLLLHPEMPRRERERKIREFRHEAAMHRAAAGHPNIVGLYSADLDNLELALEYVEGQSIRKFMRSHNPPLAERYRIIARILEIFIYLHERDILHGDIHSSNFLVTPQGEPMLFDFDMAQSANTGDQGGKTGGVFPYAPPERVSTAPLEVFNARGTSSLAEVYQLGIVFYQTLYHELPFDAATWKTLAGSILDLPPVWKPVCPSGEAIPEAVIRVLQKALEKNPADRHADMRAFADAWEQATK
jgi:serine/threonine protein kinase